jgi:hypothetical protein
VCRRIARVGAPYISPQTDAGISPRNEGVFGAEELQSLAREWDQSLVECLQSLLGQGLQNTKKIPHRASATAQPRGFFRGLPRLVSGLIRGTVEDGKRKCT